MRYLIALVLLFVFAAPASAKSVDQRFVAFGVGAWTCNDYRQAQKQNDVVRLAAVDHFVEGYLTAFNVIVGNTYDILGGQGIGMAGDWLQQYCSGHDDQSLANALAVFTSLRFPDRSSVPPRH